MKDMTAISAIIEELKVLYPEPRCSLPFDPEKPHELLFAVRLAAQCTDARVNMVTPTLFERFPDAPTMAKATAEDVEPYIRSCGLFKTKARDLVAMAQMLVEFYDGVVPNTIEELTKLPGVGRKTANLICGDVYGVQGVVVADTHCIRICGRLGFYPEKEKNPAKIEKILREFRIIF